MGTIFLNSENSTKSDPHKLLINLSDKINVKRSDKYVALSTLSMHHIWENMRMSYKNKKFNEKNEKFELPDGSNPVSEIQVYFECIIKKHGKVTDNSPVRIYVNKIGNRFTCKTNIGY